MYMCVYIYIYIYIYIWIVDSLGGVLLHPVLGPCPSAELQLLRPLALPRPQRPFIIIQITVNMTLVMIKQSLMYLHRCPLAFQTKEHNKHFF